ncbi:unnamed protein product [Merluccius merluccius]
MSLLWVSSFFSKVYVSVSPKNRVEWVQAHITERLRAKFSYHTLTLMTDVHRLSIQPVEPFNTMTMPPPIGSESPVPGLPTAFNTITFSHS